MPAATVFSFGPFELDAQTRCLTRSGKDVDISDRSLIVLLELVSNAGRIVTRDALITAAWGDVAVTDNSLEQVISSLRRVLRDTGDQAFVETVPRRGYRFVGPVTLVVRRQSDEALDALLAPHRAWLEGRAALETLERNQVASARAAFERTLAFAPDQATPHIGLANAYVMQFEMTRADAEPDTATLSLAADHAREACRLDPQSGEAWATLGFILDRTGQRADALAAARRAVMLEPDNWRHHFRLSFVGWGEERLRAAGRVLNLLPGFPLAHLMAATVHVARQALGEAQRQLMAGIVAEDQRPGGEVQRFSGVALHWLLGLVSLASGDAELALHEFERELSLEASGHLYARECAANSWYAIGALRVRSGDLDEARAAFGEAIARVSAHPLARVALGELSGRAGGANVGVDRELERLSDVDRSVIAAARLALAGDFASGARLVDAALASAPTGSAGWLLPVEPILNVASHPVPWAGVLARVRTRAA